MNDDEGDDESIADCRQKFKDNTVLKPDKYLSENMPKGYRYPNFLHIMYKTSCMEKVSITSQQAYFKQCLDENLWF